MQTKFIVAEDLALAYNVSVKELLLFASAKIFARITWFLLQNDCVLDIIERFIGIQFYKEHIMPRSWFHLLLEDSTHEINK